MRNSGTRVKGRGGDVTKEEKFGVMQMLAFQMEPRKEELLEAGKRQGILPYNLQKECSPVKALTVDQ